MRKKNIIIGETYGYIKVLSLTDRSYRTYNCRCLKCGAISTLNGSAVYSFAETGCAQCRRAAPMNKKAIKYIGHRFGHLLVKEYAGLKINQTPRKSYRYPSMICECDCGFIGEYPLKRLLDGGACSCKGCSEKNLESGRIFLRETAANGTVPISLSTQRKINKNNASGVRGVSYLKSTGKYRAYINFRRKQYHLGCYDKLEDATEARKLAEKKIYGNFFDWYQTEYPEQWDKIKDRIQY